MYKMAIAFDIQSFFLFVGFACFKCSGLIPGINKGLHMTYFILLFQLKRDALSEVESRET